MAPDLTFLDRALDDRIAENAFRTCDYRSGLIDFCSNDYLGFARSTQIKRIAEEILLTTEFRNGSTGSRLLSGHYPLFEETEALIAQFHESEAALIYNSGYDANTGLLSCIASRHDTIIYDQLVHASIRDGVRLSHSAAFSFRHNDIEDLKKKLRAANGRKFVVVESVYSMDGDMADLTKISELCQQSGAYLIVDEAHSTGIFGKNGNGLTSFHNLSDQIFARIHTFGKALGCHGAAVVGSMKLKQYLTNFSRQFIFTTALPPHSVAAIQAAYRYLIQNPAEIGQLQEKIRFFTDRIKQSDLKTAWIPSQSPIQCFVISGNDAVKYVALKLNETGFDIRPVLYPTVALGKERIRICIHSSNSDPEINSLITTLESII